MLAEAMTLASVFLIWMPAFIASYRLFQMRGLRSLFSRPAPGKRSLRDLADDLHDVLKEAVYHFSSKEFWMLLTGLALAIASSAMKLIMMYASL